MSPRINIDREKLADYCRRWQIRELAFFGSVLRDDFGPGSDVDALVEFLPGADWSLWDHFAMQEELGRMLGRKADLVTRRAIVRSQNWIRRQAILDGAEAVYVQG